jgi:hypothetical protein
MSYNKLVGIYKVDKFRYSTASFKGIFVRFVYRFRSERTGQAIGIQLSVDNNKRVRLKTGVLDKDNRIIKSFEIWRNEVDKFQNTINWCITDFLKNNPEYLYYNLY